MTNALELKWKTELVPNNRQRLSLLSRMGVWHDIATAIRDCPEIALIDEITEQGKHSKHKVELGALGRSAITSGLLERQDQGGLFKHGELIIEDGFWQWFIGKTQFTKKGEIKVTGLSGGMPFAYKKPPRGDQERSAVAFWTKNDKWFVGVGSAPCPRLGAYRMVPSCTACGSTEIDRDLEVGFVPH